MEIERIFDAESDNLQKEIIYHKYILFTLSNELYGIEALRVKEIVEYGNVTKIPMVSNIFSGVTNLRGMIIPIIDLSVRFGKESRHVSRKTCTIIIEIKHKHETIPLGIKIDAINSVINISEEDIQTAPSFGADIPMEFISSIGTYKNGFINLLDIDNILSIDDLSELASNNKFVSNYLHDVANN